MPEYPSLRIAMISYYMPSCSKIGVGYQVEALAKEMVSRGHRVDIFTACPPIEGSVFTTRQIILTGANRTFRFAQALHDVDFTGYDVIHAHGDDYRLPRRRADVHVRTLHGSNFSEAIHIRGPKERLRMALLGITELVSTIVADATVVVSPGTRRWTPWVRQVIPNGVDLRRFQPTGESSKSPVPVILFVGTWRGRKRGSELVNAFTREVRPHLSKAELWMVTQDTPSDLPAGVRSFGRVDDEKLAALYQSAWVFCLPSSYEGFGIPYVEAMASGLPVVATSNVGSRYVIGDSGAGKITSLRNLGATLRELLQNPDLLTAMGRRGSDRAVSFSLATVAASYERLYAEVGVRRRRRRR